MQAHSSGSWSSFWLSSSTMTCLRLAAALLGRCLGCDTSCISITFWDESLSSSRSIPESWLSELSSFFLDALLPLFFLLCVFSSSSLLDFFLLLEFGFRFGCFFWFLSFLFFTSSALNTSQFTFAIFCSNSSTRFLISVFELFFSFVTRFLKNDRTSGVSKVFLQSWKHSMSFLKLLSFMLIQDRQQAVFLISRMFNELVSLSQSFTIRDSEYLSFSIKGITFSKNTVKVLSLVEVPSEETILGWSENRLKASGMMLNRYLGSFLFNSLKNCLTRFSISESGSWKSIAISQISPLTLIMSFNAR